MHLFRIIERPLITEKLTELQAQGKYAFQVVPSATKQMVKEAVEKVFNVGVTKVSIVTMRGKTRRMGRRQFVSNSWKKAIVTLKPGDKIELFEGV